MICFDIEVCQTIAIIIIFVLSLVNYIRMAREEHKNKPP